MLDKFSKMVCVELEAGTPVCGQFAAIYPVGGAGVGAGGGAGSKAGGGARGKLPRSEVETWPALG